MNELEWEKVKARREKVKARRAKEYAQTKEIDIKTMLIWIWGGLLGLLCAAVVWLSLEAPRILEDRERHCISQTELSIVDCKKQPLKYFY